MTKLSRKGTFWAGFALAAGLLGASALALHTTPADAATKAVAATTIDQSASDPPFGAFLGACSADSDCHDGNVCASYRKRGNHCTHPCQETSECGSNGRCTKQNRCGLNEPIKTEP